MARVGQTTSESMQHLSSLRQTSSYILRTIPTLVNIGHLGGILEAEVAWATTLTKTSSLCKFSVILIKKKKKTKA